MKGTPGYYTVIAFDCEEGFIASGITDYCLEGVKERKERYLTDEEVETYRNALLDSKIANLEAELEKLYAQKKPLTRG